MNNIEKKNPSVAEYEVITFVFNSTYIITFGCYCDCVPVNAKD